MLFSPLGDSAVLLTLGESIDAETAARVQAIAREITQHPPPAVVDVVPAFASVAVFYDAAHVGNLPTLHAALEMLARRAAPMPASTQAAAVEIPVCYGGEFGPDLQEVADHAKLTPEEV